jgi:hypothetical protein
MNEGTGMHQLTIRGFDEQLEKCVRQLAAERQTSLNRAALTLMRRGAGLSEGRDPSAQVGSGLDKFIGVWSAEDESELQRALEPFEQIDPGFWP